MLVTDPRVYCLKEREKKFPVPPYFHPLIQQLDTIAGTGARLNGDELLHIFLNPKPAQLFLAQYLKDETIYRRSILMVESAIFDSAATLKRWDTFISEKPERGIRKAGTCPMTAKEFTIATHHIQNISISGIGVVLQIAMDEYFEELGSFLTSNYKIPSGELTRRLQSSKRFESFWNDLMPQFLLAYGQADVGNCDNLFSTVFETASRNDAFRSIPSLEEENKIRKSQEMKITKCPAQFIFIKHLLKTSIIEQSNGTLTIGPPRDGALPAFIFRKLKEQSALVPAAPACEAV